MTKAKCVLARGMRHAALLAGALALNACAVATPFTVESTGSGLPAQATIALSASDSDSGLRTQLAEALGEAFADRGISREITGRYLADYSVSVRDAKGGFTTRAPDTGEDVDWDAEPRKKRLLDGCRAQRMRATLALLDRQSGALIYRGEAEAVNCEFGNSSVRDVARQLVSDAMAKSQP